MPCGPSGLAAELSALPSPADSSRHAGCNPTRFCRRGCAGEEYSDLYDPETNIKYGTYLLRLMCEEYGCKETAAAAYHTGRGNVNSWLSNKDCSSDGKTLENIEELCYHITP